MNLRLFSIACFITLLGGPILGQVQFEGEIEYEITYLEISKEMESISNLLPKKVTFITKGNSYKMINHIEGRADQIQIMHNHDGSGYLLLDFLGHKIALKNDELAVRKSNADHFSSSVIRENDQKSILDFNCISASVCTSKDTTSVYYTNEYVSPEYKYVNLKGLPLEYTSKSNGMVIHVKAISVNKRKVEFFEFDVPYEYKKMNKEELEEIFRM